MYKYMNKYLNTVINDEDNLKRMASDDLYDLQYTVETLLKDIYDEEYRRKLLLKYNIECTQKVLEDSLNILNDSRRNNAIYSTHGNSRGGNTDGDR